MASASALLHTIILLGALQGIISGCLLYFSRYQQPASQLLAVTLWLLSLSSLNIFLNYTGIYYWNTTTAMIHALLPMVILMPVGPLIYFYIRSSIQPGFKLTRGRKMHFLPVILDLVPSITVIIYLAGVSMGMIKDNRNEWGAFIDDYNVYSDIARWLSITIYLVISLRFLSHVKSSSVLVTDHAQWLRQFTRVFLVFQTAWLIYLAVYVAPGYTDLVLDTVGWYPVYIPLAVLIYWLGIKGYMQSQSIGSRPKNIPSFKPSEVVGTVSSLRQAMEEDRLYVNPGLNLLTLSRHIGIAPKTVSAILNQHLHKNFKDFVNEYRVEALKQKLKDRDAHHLTILGVALDCGFNSKASFQRVFKEVTGVSPSEYLKSVKQMAK